MPVFVSGQSGDDFIPINQYLLNGLAINPAYAGSRDALSATLLYKNKWVNFPGSSEIQAFTSHFPLKKKKIAMGVSVDNESWGFTNKTNAYAYYARYFQFWRGNISLGLRAGMNFHNEKNSEARLRDEGDPSFFNDSWNYPGFGAGFYYYDDRFYFGAAVPYFINASEKSRDLVFDPNNYHFLISTGYLIRVSEVLKFKPNVLVDYLIDRPVNYNLALNIILLKDNLLWLGGMYKSSKELVAMVDLQIGKQLRLGYAYDYALTDLNNFQNGTHEIVLRYEFVYNVKAFTPGFF